MAFQLKNKQAMMADHDKIEIVESLVYVKASWEISHDVEKNEKVNIGACFLISI